MRFLLKKNQLALILLTLVMMLTVYYIKNPFKSGEKDTDDDDTTNVGGRLEKLAERRLLLKNSRKDIIVELDAIIASSDATVQEKAAALEQKNYLNQLTEKEILLELDIINKGYQDAFVHATEERIDVIVVADEHSVSAADEIILMTLLELDYVSSKVYVQFQTVSEVMGTAVE